MHLTTIFRRRMLAGMTALAGLVAGGSAVAQQPSPTIPIPTQPTPAPTQTADAGEVKVGKLGELLVPISGAAFPFPLPPAAG